LIWAFKGKRGQAQEVLLLGVVLLVLAIVILIGFRMISDFNTEFQSNPEITEGSKESMQRYTDSFPRVFDGIYVMALILLIVVVLISVFLIDTHPVFLAVGIPALMAVLFVNVILANVVDDVGKSSGLVSLYDQFPMMQFIASNWLPIMAVVGFVGMIILYSKRVSN